MLSDPRSIFGVHQVSPYRRSDGTFYGTVRVIKSSSLKLTGELIDLYGGSNKFPWAVEDGKITTELQLKFGEYADFLFELFLGQSVTNNVAEAAGSVSTLTNIKGTLVQAVTGVASISVLSGSEADLKMGRIVVVAKDATHVDVYYSSDIDFQRGTDVTFLNDSLKVLSNLAITSGGTTNLTGFGLKLTGGSGAIAMVAGDSASADVRPINAKSTVVTVGSAASSLPTFGCIMLAQKRGTDELTEIDLFKVKGSGLPIGFTERQWAEVDVNAKAFYDSAKDGVFKFNWVVGA